MEITKIEKNGLSCAVVQSSEKMIKDSQSALDLLMTVKYEAGTKNIAIGKECIAEDFLFSALALPVRFYKST